MKTSTIILKLTKHIFILSSILLLISCKQQEKVDLMKLKLNEKIENVADFDDSLAVGVETAEYPFCLFLEIDNSKKYNFAGIDLKEQTVYFQINSELLKTDSITKSGGAHIDLSSVKNKKELNIILKKYKSENYIYGFRIDMKNLDLKKEILKKIENKYGKGAKNINTENGLYWNLKKENKYIFYSPDYDRLTILNSSNISKTCYWDNSNGLIDFGGCDNTSYIKELLVNSTDPKNIKNKPRIKIDKNWNINNITIGKSNESDFLKSHLNKNLERVTEIQGSTGKINELQYNNDYNNFYFFFNVNKKNNDNPKTNILKGYSIMDFKRIEISFENGINSFSKREEILKKIDKNQIENYNDLKFSNYIEIKNDLFKISLMFEDNDAFSSIYVVQK